MDVLPNAGAFVAVRPGDRTPPTGFVSCPSKISTRSSPPVHANVPVVGLSRAVMNLPLWRSRREYGLIVVTPPTEIAPPFETTMTPGSAIPGMDLKKPIVSESAIDQSVPAPRTWMLGKRDNGAGG